MIASVATLEAAVALKGELLSIGTEAEDRLDACLDGHAELTTLRKLIAAIERRLEGEVRKQALKQIGQLLPELFEGGES